MLAGVRVVTLLLLQAASAPAIGPVGVLVTSERPGTGPYSNQIAKTVKAELERNGLSNVLSDAESTRQLAFAGMKNPRSCSGSRPCVAKLAAGLGDSGTLVSIDVGKLGSKLVVHVEAFAATGESLGTSDMSGTVSSYQVDVSGPIATFSEVLARKVKERAAAPKVAAAPAPVPAPPEAVNVTAPPPTSHGSLALPIGLLAGGVAALGVAVGFGVDGYQAKTSYDNSFLTGGQPFTGPDGRPASHLTQPQLDSLRTHGNASFTIALCTGLVGVALAALSTWLFVSN